ncbi:hypothetical protein [Haloferula sp. BvORR071]|uniref:hypothetical protein n=1 Tax=Haloferula sp. BvORR071 TaxID=1396141 RepID=UPI000558A737|nr:hypothetical protein [Haloferula sp. BvORR071]
MKTKPLFAWGLAAFAFAAGAGWLAGGMINPAPAAAHGEAAVKASARKMAKASPQRMPDQVKAAMAAIRNAATPEERQRATIQLARRLPVDQLALWYKRNWFDLEGGMEETIFETITRERWLAEDPEGLLGYTLERERNDLHNDTRELAGAWARRDPDAAFGFLVEKKGDDDFGYLLTGMGQALAKENPARVLAELGKLYRDPAFNEGFGELGDLFEALGEAAPDAFVHELAAWHEPIRGHALEKYTRTALKKDFAGTVAGLTGVENGSKLVLDAIRYDQDLEKQVAASRASFPPAWFAEIASSLAYRVVAENPGQWLAEDLAAAGFSAAQTKEMRDAAIELMARDPRRLASLLGEIAWTGDERNIAVSKALQAFPNAEDAAAWAAGLSDPQDIAAAQSSLEWQAKQALEKQRDKSPGSWVDKWSENASSFDYWATEPLAKWTQQDAIAAAKAFDELPDERKQLLATKLESRSKLPEPLQAQALGYLVEKTDAANQSAIQRLNRTTCEFAARWGASDPESGGKWVRSLPAGEIRSWAAKNLAAAWAEQEPAAARHWAASLPSAERTAVEDFLKEHH